MKNSTFRLLLVLLAFVALLGLFASIGAIDEGDSVDTVNDKTCDHDYTFKTVSEATCTSVGVRNVKCKKCGLEGFVEDPALGHSFVNDLGQNDGVCVICNYSCPHRNVNKIEGNLDYCGETLLCKDCGAYGFRITEHIAWDESSSSCEGCGFGLESGEIWPNR